MSDQMKKFIVPAIVIVVLIVGYYLLMHSSLGKFFKDLLGAGDALLGALSSLIKNCSKNPGICVLYGLILAPLFLIAYGLKLFINKPKSLTVEKAAAESNESPVDVVKDAFNELEDKGFFDDVDKMDNLSDDAKDVLKANLGNRTIAKKRIKLINENPDSPDNIKKQEIQNVKDTIGTDTENLFDDYNLNKNEENDIEENGIEMVPLGE